MTSIVPNKSIVVGWVTAVGDGTLTLTVESSRAAFPKAADLVAGRVHLEVAGAGAVVGDRVEIECAMEPTLFGDHNVQFVASRVSIVKRG